MTSTNDDAAVELSYEEAVALLPDGDYIHTILDGGILVGANWSRTEILDLLARSPRRDVTGPEAQSMGHGLCAYEANGRPVFIETRKEEKSS